MNDFLVRHKPTIQRPHARLRRGVTLIEVSVSILLVASLGSLIVGALVARARQQRAIDCRELAVAEAGNLMEQLTSLAWSDLTQERLTPIKLSENLRQSIPAAVLDATVEPSADKPEAKRISIQIECPGAAGQAVRPVRLTSWVYRIGPNVVAPPKEELPEEKPEAAEKEEKP